MEVELLSFLRRDGEGYSDARMKGNAKSRYSIFCDRRKGRIVEKLTEWEYQ